MLKKIGLGLAVVIAVFLVYAGLKSPDYVISRSISINAPAEKIFPYLNNSKLAETWGPWRDVDPEAKMSYSGPEEGVGSRSDWDGGEHRGQLGTGSATIVESIPNQSVKIKLEYVKPMEMHQESVYSIELKDNQSLVTWTVTGKNSFIERVMCTFVNMDKIVGGMFETGLAKLKMVVEQQP